MYRFIAYLGVVASVILGTMLGLAILILILLEQPFERFFDIHLQEFLFYPLPVLGAFVAGFLAIIHVRRSFQKQREQEHGEYLDSVSEEAGEFLRTVIKKMRYIKAVRREVWEELICHFEDELRECETDEQKQRKAEELISEFGDAKLLGKLLRRAKKRCRPLWREITARTFQAIGVIILYFMICFGRFAIGTPTISVNYIDWLNDRVRANRAESENAYPYYKKAVEACVKIPEQAYKICNMWPGDLNDVEVQILLEWANDNEEALELVIEGTKRPHYWTVYSTTEKALFEGGLPDDALMKELSSYKTLARALNWRSRYKAYKGDIVSALGDCFCLVKFSNQQQGKGLLIEQLVGIAIEALAQSTISMIIEKVDVPADALKNIQEQLRNEYARAHNIINLEGEKVFWYDIVQRGFTDDGKGDGRVLKEGLPFVVKNAKSALMGFFLWTYPDRREFMATIERYFEQAGVLLGKTPWQLQVEGESRKWDEIGKECNMLQILEPAHRRVGQLVWRMKTHRVTLLTVLAVLRYEKENGRCPENLHSLVGLDYLKELPMDPWSDKPLVYKRGDDGFVLYGVGSNFTDDGGEAARYDDGRIRKYADEGDWVFWPVGK